MPSKSSATRPTPTRSHTRIEYIGFEPLEAAREYRYAVHFSEGSCEFRFRIALDAFARARVLVQDGPDVCFQLLTRDLAGGDNLQREPRSIRHDELAAYHDAHTPAPRGGFGSAAAARRTGR